MSQPVQTQTRQYEPPYISLSAHIQTAADVPGKGPGLYPPDETEYLRRYGTTDTARINKYSVPR